jgi:uncharacterized protein YbjT (DUF2867 family)
MILITGASGNVGSELVKQLSAKGVETRVITRDKSKLKGLAANVDVVEGEITDAATLDSALVGVDKVFLFPLIMDLSHDSTKLLVDKSKAHGVKHIVMLSSMGAIKGATDLGRLHREKEEIIEQSGLAWTFVRPGGFMTNVLQWLETMESQGKVFNPAGAGQSAPISNKDIAAAAAVALTAPGHEGKIYTLTGPELLSAGQQVEILSRVLGCKIDCLDVPPSAVAGEMSKKGMPQWLIESLSKMWGALAAGELARKSDDLEKLTGSKGETFEAWAKDNRDLFKSVTHSLAK